MKTPWCPGGTSSSSQLESTSVGSLPAARISGIGGGGNSRSRGRPPPTRNSTGGGYVSVGGGILPDLLVAALPR